MVNHPNLFQVFLFNLFSFSNLQLVKSWHFGLTNFHFKISILFWLHRDPVNCSSYFPSIDQDLLVACICPGGTFWSLHKCPCRHSLHSYIWQTSHSLSLGPLDLFVLQLFYTCTMDIFPFWVRNCHKRYGHMDEASWDSSLTTYMLDIVKT